MNALMNDRDTLGMIDPATVSLPSSSVGVVRKQGSQLCHPTVQHISIKTLHEFLKLLLIIQSWRVRGAIFDFKLHEVIPELDQFISELVYFLGAGYLDDLVNAACRHET